MPADSGLDGDRATRVDAPGEPSDYRASLDRLFQRRRFGLKPGLEVVEALLAELGHPERAYPAVHVTGSKGKGSVAAMTQAILSAAGLRTGLFTSPHLVSYRERIQLDGHRIEPADVVAGLARVEAAADALRRRGTVDREPTFFEATTALALDWFARERADAAVVEVGVGGRLDATNVLDARVGVITTIELEHTDILGPTVADIAREKSGIFHAGMVGVIGQLPTDARRVVAETTGRLGVPVWHLGEEVHVGDRTLSEKGQTFTVRVPGRTWEAVDIPLLGRFQPSNAALALAAAHRFLERGGHAPAPASARRALSAVRWPGRLERIARRPELFFDVAHTPESARAIAESLGEIAPLSDASASAILFGCLRGKDVGRILDALAPLARTLVVVPVRSERGLDPAEIRPLATGRFPRVVVTNAAEAGLALARAATGPDGFTLVVGSDYLVGELMRSAQPAVDEPDLSDPGLGDRPSPPPDR